jgi:hypothetical protein
MKKLLLTLTMAVASASVFAQGTVNIATDAGTSTRFFTTYRGDRIAGNEYLVQLFYANGANATDTASFKSAGIPVGLRTGAAAGVLASTEVLLPDVTPAGGAVTLQFRAWSAVLGTAWQTAHDAWLAQGPDDSRLYGESDPFNYDSFNPTPPPEPAIKIGAAFPGAVLHPVPEPSVIALGLMGGLGALVLFRRRK